MQGNDFSERLEHLRRHANHLQHDLNASAFATNHVLQDTLRHLQVSLEQLEAAYLSMLEQHKKLLALRVDAERQTQHRLRESEEHCRRLIAERKRLQEEVVAISEMERARIGRDLHDVLGQTFTGISFLGKVLEKKLQEQGLRVTEPHEIILLAGEGMRQTRALARGLFSVEITAGEFISAMKALAMDVQYLYGLGCRFDYPRDRQVVRDDRIATHLYHIAQEALTNAVKHGRADTAEIHLETRAEALVLRIRDNGVGFADGNSVAGIGLRIMRHRASLIGADLRIDSAPGQGTTVACSIPLARNAC